MSIYIADTWDRRFLELALLIRTWSKDPSTKHATIIVRPDRTICSTGYNGFPRRMPDLDEWLEDREEKYPRVIHGELNSLLSAPERVVGYTAYVTSGFPCFGCTGALNQAGVARIVAMQGDEDYQSRWGEQEKKSKRFLRDSGVPFTVIDTDTWRVLEDWAPGRPKS